MSGIYYFNDDDTGLEAQYDADIYFNYLCAKDKVTEEDEEILAAFDEDDDDDDDDDEQEDRNLEESETSSSCNQNTQKNELSKKKTEDEHAVHDSAETSRFKNLLQEEPAEEENEDDILAAFDDDEGIEPFLSSIPRSTISFQQKGMQQPCRNQSPAQHDWKQQYNASDLTRIVYAGLFFALFATLLLQCRPGYFHEEDGAEHFQALYEPRSVLETWLESLVTMCSTVVERTQAVVARTPALHNMMSR